MESYLSFDRHQWAKLRDAVSVVLSEDDLRQLQGINENLTMKEVVDIYLPLSRLLNIYAETNQNRASVLHQFLNSKQSASPFIIGIAGSVAVGKSTTARLLKMLLSLWENHPKVELVTTDGFLYPNQVLIEKNLMNKKGFPQSYDMKKLIQFISDVKAGKKDIQVPTYSHLIYDITDEIKIVDQPDILIIEGLNVLQSSIDYPQSEHYVFISDFLDFSIYVDADAAQIERWYIERFLKLRLSAFNDRQSYFHHYTLLSEQEAIDKAKTIWHDINGKNLAENILPTKDRAHLLLRKGINHVVEKVFLRK